MMKLIAIPTRDGMVDDHFGHCAYYTVVAGQQLIAKTQKRDFVTCDICDIKVFQQQNEVE